MRKASLSVVFAIAVGCTGSQDVAQGPGSGLNADLLDGQHAADFAPASGLATGAIVPSQTRRMGAITDVARGRKGAITAGTFGGFGPTGEWAQGDYWSTNVFPARLTVDLGALVPVDYLSFEGRPRGDPARIPAHSGANAYVLSLSQDGTTWVDQQAVAPVDGDHFVHALLGANARYVRLTVNGPATTGNAVDVSMFRVMSYATGDATAIEASRVYYAGGVGPFCVMAAACPAGFTNRGTIGVIYSTASGTAPYTLGGAYSTGWSWIHPVMCCR